MLSWWHRRKPTSLQARCIPLPANSGISKAICGSLRGGGLGEAVIRAMNWLIEGMIGAVD